VNIVFHIDHFEAVAEVMKPRKRRHGRTLSPEERQRLIEMGKNYRFSPGLQCSRDGLECVPMPQAVFQ